MKKGIIYISALLPLLLAVPNAEANDRLAIRNAAARKKSGQLEIYLSVHDSGVPKLRANEQVSIAFSLESPDGTMDLPPVLYCGSQRFHYAERSELLADGEATRAYGVRRDNRKSESDDLEYRIAVSFEEWMEHADLEYRMIFRDVRGLESESTGTLISDLFPPLPPWQPDPVVYRAMAWFTPPEAEPVKRRSEGLVVQTDYGRNEVEISSRRGNNATELEKLYGLLQSITGDGLKVADTLRLRFHGSPEGTYRENERLMQARAQRIKQQLSARYKALNGRIVSECVPEDWNALQAAVEQAMRNDTLFLSLDAASVCNDPDLAPDARERILRQIEGGKNWKILQDSIFPGLRRIGIEAEYTIRNLSDRQLRDLALDRPEYLSGEEMFRAAFLYGTESREFVRAFEMAAERFAGEWRTVNNVAGAYLRAGDAENARHWLELLPDGIPEACVNLGVYYYLLGDPEEAEKCFLLAREAGIEKADENLKLMIDSFEKKNKSRTY